MGTTSASGFPLRVLAENYKVRVATRDRAEDIGIIIGPTVVKLDWHSSIPLPASPARGRIVERQNCVTVSGGDENWDSLAKHPGEESEWAMAA
jgi:hypothetical protein